MQANGEGWMRGKKVLIVDDDPEMLAQGKHLFSGAGAEVLSESLAHLT